MAYIILSDDYSKILEYLNQSFIGNRRTRGFGAAYAEREPRSGKILCCGSVSFTDSPSLHSRAVGTHLEFCPWKAENRCWLLDDVRGTPEPRRRVFDSSILRGCAPETDLLYWSKLGGIRVRSPGTAALARPGCSSRMSDCAVEAGTGQSLHDGRSMSGAQARLPGFRQGRRVAGLLPTALPPCRRRSSQACLRFGNPDLEAERPIPGTFGRSLPMPVDVCSLFSPLSQRQGSMFSLPHIL